MKFQLDFNPEAPDQVSVEIDSRYIVTILRTEEGLTLSVYPRSENILWECPIDTFEVSEQEILDAEKEIAE